MLSQSTGQALMIRPACFGWNPETASSNGFQCDPSPIGDAAGEFENALSCLRRAGVEVWAFDDDEDLQLPDAVFPNNWLSTHADGTLVLYPMFSPTRRRERRDYIVDVLTSKFVVNQVVDFSAHELEGRFLEGTGSMVLDRINMVTYACRSPRTDEGLVRLWCDQMGYRPVVFTAQSDGQDVYHTNVMMSIGTTWAVVCGSWISESDRERVLSELAATGREVIDISDAETRAFCGNILEVQARDGVALAGSWSLQPVADIDFRSRIAPHVKQIIGAPLPTIWSQGGGGLRCMICELFLEPR